MRIISFFTGSARKIYQKPLTCITALILVTLIITAGHPAMAGELPSLAGVEAYNPNSPTSGWTNTLDIRVEPNDVTGIPIKVFIDENEKFTSPVLRTYGLTTDPLLRTIECPVKVSSGKMPVSPDNRMIMLQEYDQPTKLFDLETESIIRTYSGYTGNISSSCSFNTDGTRMATACYNNNNVFRSFVKIWDVQTGYETHTLYNHDNYHSGIAIFNHDSTEILTHNSEETIRLWDAQTAELIRTYVNDSGVRALAWSPDDTKFVTGNYDNTAKLWDRQTGAVLHTFSGHSSTPGYIVKVVAFSPDGTKVLTGSEDETAILWDIQTGEKLMTLTDHWEDIYSVDFSPDGRKIVTGSLDKTAILWDAQTGQRLRIFRGHDFGVYLTRFIQGGSNLLTASQDNTIKLWDTRNSYSYRLDAGDEGLRTVYVRLLNSSGFSATVSSNIVLDTIAPGLPGTPHVEHGDWAFPTLTFNWDAAADNGGISSYDCKIGTRAGQHDVFFGNVGAVPEKSVTAKVGQTVYCQVRAIDLAGNIGPWSEPSDGIVINDSEPLEIKSIELFSASSLDTIWTNTPEIIVTLNDVKAIPHFVQFDEDPELGSPVELELYQQTSPVIRTFSGHEGEVLSVAFSPDGTKVLTGSSDNTAKLFDATTGMEILSYTGHQRSVNSVAFSPDGTQALTGATNPHLWDVQTGEIIRSFASDTYQTYSVAFSRDGTKIAEGGIGAKSCIYDVSTGQILHTFNQKDYRTTQIAYVKSIAFSPDGRNVLSGGRDDLARLWDLDTGYSSLIFGGQTDDIEAVAFSSDGTTMATGSLDKTVRLWNYKTGGLLNILRNSTAGVQTIDFSADGSKILLGNLFKMVYVLDVRTGMTIRRIKGNVDSIMSSRFSPDGTKVLTDDGNNASLWDARIQMPYSLEDGSDGQRQVFVRLRNDAGQSAIVSDNIGLDRASPSQPGTCEVENGDWSFNPVRFHWEAAQDVLSGVASYECRIGTARGESDIFEGNLGDTLEKSIEAEIGQTLHCQVRAIDRAGNVGPWSLFSWPVTVSDANVPDLSRIELYSADVYDVELTTTKDVIIALNAFDNLPRWVDIDENHDFSSPTIHDFTDQVGPLVCSFDDICYILDVSFSSDGSKVLMGSKDKTATLWDTHTGAKLRSFTGHSSHVSSVAFSPDGTKALTGSWDGTVRIWDIATGDEILNIPWFSCYSVAFSPDGSKILAGGYYGNIALLDAQTGEEIRKFEGHVGHVYAVAYSTDGSMVVSGGNDSTVRLWDAQSGVEIHTCTGHESQVHSVAFSPDGSMALSGGFDSTARLWDTKTGDEIRVFNEVAHVSCVAFSPDETRILTGSVVFARLWDIQTGEALQCFYHTSEIFSAAFSPDGYQVLTAGYLYSAKLWDMRPRYYYTLDDFVDGLKTIYVRLRNNAGTSQTVSDYIGMLYENAAINWMHYE